MSKYSKNSVRKLEEFLYNSHIHDSRLENIRYDFGRDKIEIELFNPIFDVKYYLVFSSIEVMFTTRGKWYANREIISSLTIEDFSYLKNYLVQFDEYAGEPLYLLFQMFSGDEVHIVSKEVSIEIHCEKGNCPY